METSCVVTMHSKHNGVACSGESTVIPTGTQISVVKRGAHDRHMYQAIVNGRTWFGWLFIEYVTV